MSLPGFGFVLLPTQPSLLPVYNGKVQLFVEVIGNILLISHQIVIIPTKGGGLRSLAFSEGTMYKEKVRARWKFKGPFTHGNEEKKK